MITKPTLPRPTWVAALAAAVLTAGLAPAKAPAPPPAPETLKQSVLQLNNVTGTTVIEGQIKTLAAEPEQAKSLVKAGLSLSKEKKGSLNYNAAYILARVAQDLKDVDSSQQLYKLCSDQALQLRSGFKMVQVYDDLYKLYTDNKDFARAARISQEILGMDAGKEVDEIKPFVLERLIQAMARAGKIDEALKQTETLIERDKGGWYFVQLKAWVQREGGKFEDAIKTYEDVIERIKTSERLEDKAKTQYTDRVRYMMSGLYVEMKQIDKAAGQLQALLKEKPDDPTYNNDLGFIWADNDMNLDQSEKLIRKAIEEDRKQRKVDAELDPEDDKDNAAYLDSLGWVLFKKKQYPEAKKWLLKAVEDKDGQHLEILDHLADIHMALGEKAEAVKVWKKALEQDVNGKREEQRREIIQKKLKAAEGK
jgi:tetratricopeptide (TPR) repeat protein